MMTQTNQSTIGLKRALATVMAASFAITGCTDSDTVDHELSAVESSRQSTRNVAAEIAAHPNYSELSQQVSDQLSTMIGHLANRNEPEVMRLVTTLRACSQNAPKKCIPVLTRVGFSAEDLYRNRALGTKIAADIGFDQLEPDLIAAEFRRAQWISEGIAGDSALLVGALDGTDLECEGECLDALGNLLSLSKAEVIASASSGDDDDGGVAGTLAVIAAVASVVLALEDWIWNSDEEDKACEEDSDCPSGEYCHKVGDNDCRPKLDEGQLCSRGGNCKSNCCKPHISAAFLPICRPASKC